MRILNQRLKKRGRIFADDYKLNIDDQGALYEINEKSAIDYGERESVYQEEHRHHERL